MLHKASVYIIILACSFAAGYGVATLNMPLFVIGTLIGVASAIELYKMIQT